MRLLNSAVATATAIAFVAGCSGGSLSSGSALPAASVQSGIAESLKHRPLSIVDVAPANSGDVGIGRLHISAATPLMRRAKTGTYASTFLGTAINGYPNLNPDNVPPNCVLNSAYGFRANGTAGDLKGNFIVPGYTGGQYFTINVYKAKTCGTVLGAPADETGQPASAAALNASTGNIVVGEIVDYTVGYGSNTGAVVVCSISAGCSAPLVNSSVIGYGGGVTTNKKGDCWFSTYGASSAILVYWKGCTGPGQVTTGYSSAAYGGLFTDTDGNIGQITFAGTLDIYKGCDPACSLLSSTSLPGKSLYGNLNVAGNTLVIGDYTNGTCDVFKYSPTGSTYEYSFSNGLDRYNYVESCVEAKTNRP